MEQSGDWWYSDSDQSRSRGPAVPPQREQEHTQTYRPPPYQAPQQHQPPAPLAVAGKPATRKENHAVTAVLLVLILGIGLGFA